MRAHRRKSILCTKALVSERRRACDYAERKCTLAWRGKRERARGEVMQMTQAALRRIAHWDARVSKRQTIARAARIACMRTNVRTRCRPSNDGVRHARTSATHRRATRSLQLSTSASTRLPVLHGARRACDIGKRAQLEAQQRTPRAYGATQFAMRT